jgi:chromate transporter
VPGPEGKGAFVTFSSGRNDALQAPTHRPTAARVFLAFLRLGLTAFGGPAMVSYIGDLAVAGKRWLSGESFREGVGLCQSLPGATAMQTAAYAGLRAGGTSGGLAAYAGFGLPAFLMMLALSAVYDGARDVPLFASVFRGLKVIVVAIVANATVNFGRASLSTWKEYLLAAVGAVYLFAGGSPILVVAGAAAAGLLFRRNGEGEAPSDAPVGAPAGRGVRDAAILTALAAVGLAVLRAVDGNLFGLAEVMLKVDLFAFGGGFASLPIMFHQVVEVRGWLDARTFLDGIALGQVTPGPIVITATFIGYQVAGLAGALVATLAIFTPSFIVLVAAVPYLDDLRRSPLFHRALRGILASFVGLLLAVTLRFAGGAQWGLPTATVCAIAFAALRLRADLLWVVLGGIAVSAVFL